MTAEESGSAGMESAPFPPPTAPPVTNFIRQIVEEDLASGKHKHIITRFPPEPNGFLHLGHAKSICLNFGIARDYGGVCNMRFDDTNPTKEDTRFIESIKEDVKWLGGNFGERLFFTSDYFDQLHKWAFDLIKKGYAYVDHQTEEEVRKNRGSLTEPGVDSPYRDRPVEESIHWFEQMTEGKCKEGECVLRAKINMAHGNMNMRDPPIYRVRFHDHPRTGSKWCVYPIYDYAHGQSDSIENITHSICTLEFEDHRPLYEWLQEKLEITRTRQIEFARLNTTYTVMSKRKLLCLVQEKWVHDWDDPRMPTVSGMRRRGFPAIALRDFCERVGVAKRDNVINVSLLDLCVQQALHPVALRRNVIVDPLRVVVTNFPEDKEAIAVEAANHPDDAAKGTRTLHFTKVLYIDRADFQEVPEPKFFRLAPGKEVRLRYGYWIKCEKVEKGEKGEVSEVHVTYDPETHGGNAPSDGRKVKGTLHWISEKDAIEMEVRLYDRLFTSPDPDNPPEGKTWQDLINPHSEIIKKALGERSLVDAVHPYKGGDYYQFERVGFFVADYDHKAEAPVFNRAVELTDTYAAKAVEKSKEAQDKEAQRLIREKAAAERAKKKEEKAKREAAKAAAKAAAGEGAVASDAKAD